MKLFTILLSILVAIGPSLACASEFSSRALSPTFASFNPVSYTASEFSSNELDLIFASYNPDDYEKRKSYRWLAWTMVIVGNIGMLIGGGLYSANPAYEDEESRRERQTIGAIVCVGGLALTVSGVVFFY